MDTEIVGGALGPEAKYDLAIKDGKVQLSLSYGGAETDATLQINVSAAVFLDKLKAMIPGQVDDLLIGMLESAFGLK